MRSIAKNGINILHQILKKLKKLVTKSDYAQYVLFQRNTKTKRNNIMNCDSGSVGGSTTLLKVRVKDRPSLSLKNLDLRIEVFTIYLNM